MATIGELEKAGKVHRYDPALDVGEQELRMLHASPKLRDWVEKDLPALESQWNIEKTPMEQFDAYMALYAAGEELVFEREFRAFMPRAIMPLGDGVWYLKTPDLRIFGWFWRKDCFIGVVADTAGRIKEHNLYQGYRDEVARFRNELNINEPKFIPGTNPDDVISNYTFPQQA